MPPGHAVAVVQRIRRCNAERAPPAGRASLAVARHEAGGFPGRAAASVRQQCPIDLP